MVSDHEIVFVVSFLENRIIDVLIDIEDEDIVDDNNDFQNFKVNGKVHFHFKESMINKKIDNYYIYLKGINDSKKHIVIGTYDCI